MEQDEPSLRGAATCWTSPSDFSRWYTLGNQDRDKRVLVEGNEALRAARLALTDAMRITLAAGPDAAGHRRRPENM